MAVDAEVVPHEKFQDLLFLLDNQGAEIREEAFQGCVLNCTGVGIEIQHDEQQQWFIPWEAMPEIFDGTAAILQVVPESHPHVKQLCARFSFGFSSCTGCKFHLASCSKVQLESISRIVQQRSSQAVAIEGLPGSETEQVEVTGAPSYLDDSDVTSSPAGILNSADLPYTSCIITPRAPPRMEAAATPQLPQREVLGESNRQIPQELLAALLDRPEVPEPLTLQHAWLHLPPVCPHYHRCLLLVDKLGLSLRPLGRTKNPAAELHTISGLKVLHTESLSFPLSSILDVEEVADLPPPASSGAPEVQTWRQHFGRKHFIPLGRFCFSRRWKSVQKQKPCPEYAERLPAAAKYMAMVKIRAGVTGKMPGQERIPPCMRMRDSRPPVQLALALYEKEEVTKLIATVLAFKSYQASTALQSILFKTRAIHSRSKIPFEEAEEPPDARAAPGASQPRIISNDDGDVFWYVPKKQENGSFLGKSKVRLEPCVGDEDRGTISI